MADYSNRMHRYDRHATHHELREPYHKRRVWPADRYIVNLSYRQVCAVRRALFWEKRRMNGDNVRHDIAVDECLRIFENLI